MNFLSPTSECPLILNSLIILQGQTYISKSNLAPGEVKKRDQCTGVLCEADIIGPFSFSKLLIPCWLVTKSFDLDQNHCCAAIVSDVFCWIKHLSVSVPDHIALQKAMPLTIGAFYHREICSSIGLMKRLMSPTNGHNLGLHTRTVCNCSQECILLYCIQTHRAASKIAYIWKCCTRYLLPLSISKTQQNRQKEAYPHSSTGEKASPSLNSACKLKGWFAFILPFEACSCNRRSIVATAPHILTFKHKQRMNRSTISNFWHERINWTVRTMKEMETKLASG